MSKKTPVNLVKPDFTISKNDMIFSIGSCFAEEFSKKLKYSGISSVCNPFGTVYNVYSIYKTLEILFTKKQYTQDDLFFYNNKFISFEHSTMFDSQSKDEVLSKINDNIKRSSNFLKKTDVFIITPGTSVVYKHKKDNQIVANCHKLPGDLFIKYILSYNETLDYIKKIIELIKANNKNAKIILTLSPVRHNPGELTENSYSKSILRTAIEDVIEENIYYFPSYEIVLDELRNYKFYKKDSVHIENSAINYVIKKFKLLFYSNDLKEIEKKLISIVKMLNHKTENINTEAYIKLLENIFDKLIDLYDKNRVIIIEKYLFIVIKRILENNYNDKIIEIVKKKLDKINTEFILYIKTIISIKQEDFKHVNPEYLNYQNQFLPLIKKYTNNYLMLYYLKTNQFLKIEDLLVKHLNKRF